MKKNLLIPLVVLMVSCSTKEFTFVQMTDTQIGFMDRSENFIHSDTLMRKAVEAVNALRPEAVIITGDLINTPGNAMENEIFERNLALIEAPVHYIPGNHDIMGYTEEKHDDYLALREYDRFSFTLHKCAFIGFDTNCICDGATEAEAQQYEWLKGELEKASGSRHIFLFMHCPVVRESMDEAEDYFNFSMPMREKYISLFKEYGVDAAFAGHTHCQYSTEIEGIKFYTAAAVGNCLGHGFPGYHTVHVTKGGVDVEYTPTPGVNWSSPSRPPLPPK